MNRAALLTLTSILIVSCELFNLFEPDPPELPVMTCVGEETVGCLRNGEVFVPCYAGMQSNHRFRYWPFSHDGQEPNLFLSFDCGRESIRIRIEVDSLNPWSPRDFTLEQMLDSNGYPISRADYTNTDDGYHEFVCLPGMFGELRISGIDTANRVICGTFAFNAVNANTGDTVYIREGRFDEKY